MQRIYINVPYEQKDEAKLLGARWDADVRRWYITGQQDALLFSKWFGDAVQRKPLVAGDRVTLSNFLRENYVTTVSLTFKSARAFGVPYPLKPGWAQKYADRTALRSAVTVGKKANLIKPKKKPKVPAHKPVKTGPAVFVPLCNCTTPPWEDCEHTDALASKAMFEMLS